MFDPYDEELDCFMDEYFKLITLAIDWRNDRSKDLEFFKSLYQLLKKNRAQWNEIYELQGEVDSLTEKQNEGFFDFTKLQTNLLKAVGEEKYLELGYTLPYPGFEFIDYPADHQTI